MHCLFSFPRNAWRCKRVQGSFDCSRCPVRSYLNRGPLLTCCKPLISLVRSLWNDFRKSLNVWICSIYNSCTSNCTNFFSSRGEFIEFAASKCMPLTREIQLTKLQHKVRNFCSSFPNWRVCRFLIETRRLELVFCMSAYILEPVGGGGTLLYKVYRYVPPQRVWFSSRFGLHTYIAQIRVYTLPRSAHCWLGISISFFPIYNICLLILSIPNYHSSAKHFDTCYYNHSLSLDAAFMVSKTSPVIGEPPGGGYYSAPRSNPLPFYTIFFRKGTPFVCLLLEKGTPFIYLLKEELGISR